MAIEQPLKRKRGRPAGSQSAKSKMEQKMALVHQRLALLDTSSSSSSSNESDKDNDHDHDDCVLLDEKLAIVAAPQSVVIDCDDSDDWGEVVPLNIVKPTEVETEQSAVPDVPQTCNTQNNATKVSDVNSKKKCVSAFGTCVSAMERAKEIQAKLPAEHPSFIKNMLHSHVVQGFWLGIPSKFCKYLPEHYTRIVLEDEDGNNFDSTYLGARQGLSAGWRGFAIEHDIKVGDVVVFQLVTSTKFKVYIIRAKSFTTSDGALGLLSFKACKKGNISKEGSSDDVKSKEDHPKVTRVSSKVAHKDSNNPVSGEIDGMRYSDSDIIFDDVTSFSNFNIIVDSVVIDCKFPDHLRRTYYELCCAQKSFLHKHLLKQLNLKLVVGVIMETTNIAEGIRACKAHTCSRDDFVIWKKTLESFELLGMNVAFLLQRVNDLLGLPAQPGDPLACEKYKEIKLEQARAAKKMKALESKLRNLKDSMEQVDAEIEEMQSNAKKSKITLQKIATAPW